MLAFTGAGGASLDAATGWDVAGIEWGFGALGLGIIAGVAMVGSRQAEIAADEAQRRAA